MNRTRIFLLLFFSFNAVVSMAQVDTIETPLLNLEQLTYKGLPFQGELIKELDTSLQKPNNITSYGWLQYDEFVIQCTDTSSYSIIEFYANSKSELVYNGQSIRPDITIPDLIALIGIEPNKIGDDYIELPCADMFYQEIGFSLLTAKFSWVEGELSRIRLFTAC